MLSCIIPALNSAHSLARAVKAVRAHVGEVLVVDGGSADGTPERARSLGLQVIASPRGRGKQLAAGIAAASGDRLLLLHADTVLGPGWPEAAAALRPDQAGYFRFRLDSLDPKARRLERVVAWRCRRFDLPYGDQGLLLSRALLDQAGGMRALPLMEDVDLVRRLRGRLVPLDADAVTSAARWEREGYVRRSARNLLCLALYAAGVPPARLRTLYG